MCVLCVSCRRDHVARFHQTRTHHAGYVCVCVCVCVSHAGEILLHDFISDAEEQALLAMCDQPVPPLWSDKRFNGVHRWVT